MNKKIVVFIVAIIVSTISCTTNGTKSGTKNIDYGKWTGGIIGAVGGAYLGNQIGSGAGRAIATAAGGALGAALGSYIGGELSNYFTNEHDKQEAAKALNSQEDNKTTTWESPESGKEIQVTTKNTREEKRNVTIVRKKNIAPPPALELLGENYKAKNNANVRQAPTTNSSIVSSLTEGDIFTAVGKVKGKNWYLVAKNNVSVGYVYGKLIELDTNDVVAQKNVIRDVIELDDLDKPITNDVVELDDVTVAETVVVSTNCRDIDVSDGSSTTSSTACKGSDGAWEII